MNQSEYGQKIAELVRKFEEDLFTHPLPAEGFVRALRSTVEWTNNINRADDGRFGIHNSTDMNSTVKAACLNAAEVSKTIYANQADKVNTIQADIPLADYLDRHNTVVATAIEHYRLAARPFSQWKAFQSVRNDLQNNRFPSCWQLIVEAHAIAKGIRFDQYKLTVLNNLNDIPNLALHFPADLERYKAAVNAVGKLDQPATAEQVRHLICSARVDGNPNSPVIQLTKYIPAVTTQIPHPARTLRESTIFPQRWVEGLNSVRDSFQKFQRSMKQENCARLTHSFTFILPSIN